MQKLVNLSQTMHKFGVKVARFLYQLQDTQDINYPTACSPNYSTGPLEW